MTLKKISHTKAYKIEQDFADLITNIYVSMGNKEKIKELKTSIEFHEIQNYPVQTYKDIYEQILTEFSY